MDISRPVYHATIRERLRANFMVSLVDPIQPGNTTLARMLAEQTADALHFCDLESPADLFPLGESITAAPLPRLVDVLRSGAAHA
ncbi:MAG TPA: hypothetical protein PLE38_15155 [Usitatibacteraceae bacterium]|jgi:hypothetical protein|nr:hypothetical protein [Usitatibacteraceae bacterium]